jgi:hypothetical protein
LVVYKNGQATAATGITAAATVGVGSRQVTLTAADADLVTAEAQEKVIVLKYSIIDESGVTDGSLVAGAKKLKATATFGASAANKTVEFTLENARTGAVRTYYRKANASGVASFTLRFRGTFDVTASYGDSITDTVTLKK